MVLQQRNMQVTIRPACGSCLQKMLISNIKHAVFVITVTSLLSTTRKSERAKDHLIKWPMFTKSMMEMDADSHPLWLNESLSNKELKSGQSSLSGLSVSQTSMKQFCLPHLKQSELKMIEDSLEMHFYITGTLQPTCSRQSTEIGFYQEQCTTADVYSSGWH